MYILGINAYHGDVSAALLRDGVLVAAVEEERFRRIKHWAGFPTMAIRSVLAEAGIRGSDVAHVAVSRAPRAHLLRKAMFALRYRPDVKLIRDRLKNAGRVRDLNGPLAEALDGATPALRFVEHHPAHLASSFFVSPFDDAACCAIDGFGDFVSTSFAVGKGNRIDVLDHVFFPHSLGMMYTAVTQYLGFHGYGDEFKVMGLAPYGKPAFVGELRQLRHLTAGGKFELDLRFFRHWSDGVEMEWDDGYPTLGRVFTPALEELLGPARQAGEPLTARHEDIAHSLQAVHEESAFHVLNGLWERTKNPRLCLAGGCAMNSVANGKVRTHTPFRQIYIQPASGDNGTALGADRPRCSGSRARAPPIPSALGTSRRRCRRRSAGRSHARLPPATRAARLRSASRRPLSPPSRRSHQRDPVPAPSTRAPSRTRARRRALDSRHGTPRRAPCRCHLMRAGYRSAWGTCADRPAGAGCIHAAHEPG